MLQSPDYRHRLDQRKRNFDMLEEFVHCMANNGANVCAQVGSNWVHASGLGVQGIREHCARLEGTYGVAVHMAGYALVEALRSMNVERVALNAVYHWQDWWGGTVSFLREAAFNVIWAGNFVDQGWFADQEAVNRCRWIFDGDLAQNSFTYVAERAPDADVYLANGMCNFRTDADGQPERLLHLTPTLKSLLGKPVIAHDTALYWRIFKSLDVRPVGSHGRLLGSL